MSYNLRSKKKKAGQASKPEACQQPVRAVIPQQATVPQVPVVQAPLAAPTNPQVLAAPQAPVAVQANHQAFAATQAPTAVGAYPHTLATSIKARMLGPIGWLYRHWVVSLALVAVLCMAPASMKAAVGHALWGLFKVLLRQIVGCQAAEANRAMASISKKHYTKEQVDKVLRQGRGLHWNEY